MPEGDDSDAPADRSVVSASDSVVKVAVVVLVGSVVRDVTIDTRDVRVDLPVDVDVGTLSAVVAIDSVVLVVIVATVFVVVDGVTDIVVVGGVGVGRGVGFAVVARVVSRTQLRIGIVSLYLYPTAHCVHIAVAAESHARQLSAKQHCFDSFCGSQNPITWLQI